MRVSDVEAVLLRVRDPFTVNACQTLGPVGVAVGEDEADLGDGGLAVDEAAVVVD